MINIKGEQIMETRPRTISITGFKTSLDDAVITATVNGNLAYTGPVSNTEIAALFSTDIDVTAMTIEESNPAVAPGNSIETDINIDQFDPVLITVICESGSIKIVDVESTPLQVDFFTTVSLTPQALSTDNPDFTITDPKFDVELDGIPQSVSRLDGLIGAWYYEVPAGSTLSFKSMIRKRLV
jgi:hypothetical protein